MPEAGLTGLELPELPRPHFVGRGYFSIAYYVFEPETEKDNVPGPLSYDTGEEPGPLELFDPEWEPDYFLENGYPEDEPHGEDPEQEKYTRTIVLCHGLAAGALQFTQDARFFARQGFLVIVPDLRGHGRSKMSDVKNFGVEDFTIDVLAQDVIAILDKEKISTTHWVGNSLGGLLALSILQSDPGRIEDLVVFGTSFTMKAPAFLLPAMRIFAKLVGKKRHDQILAGLASPDPKAQAIIHETARQASMKCIFMIARNLTNYDLVDNALNSKSAILMLRGQNDVAINNALRITLTEMKSKNNFFLRDIANAGHCANLDQPQAVREEIMDFIGGGWIFYDPAPD